MTSLICPCCHEAIELEAAYTASNVAAAPNIARAMGLGSGDALLAIHQGQAMHRNEATVEAHLRTHTPLEWVTAIKELQALADSAITLIASSDETLARRDRDDFDKLASRTGVSANLSGWLLRNADLIKKWI